jgi:hypothetical protein
MEDNVSNREESENLLIIVLQAFEYHQLEAFLHRRVSGLQKNMRRLQEYRAWQNQSRICQHFKH